MPLRKKTGIPIPLAPAVADDEARAATVPPSVTLNVPHIWQEQSQWCWAACTAMFARYLGVPDPKQCELANFLHAQSNCCQKPTSAKCNQPCLYVRVVEVAQQAGMDGIGPDHPLSLNTLVSELVAKRPVEIGLNWSAGGGHLIVVYGYTTRGMFLVHDPWNGSGVATYGFLASAYGMGVWGCSFGRFVKRS